MKLELQRIILGNKTVELTLREALKNPKILKTYPNFIKKMINIAQKNITILKSILYENVRPTNRNHRIISRVIGH